MTPAQCRAGRALLDWTQPKLAGAACLGLSTIVDFERGRRALSIPAVAAIQTTLESAGIEFTNGDQPGVKLRKATMKRPNEGERAETAKKYAREWTEYCKANESMAFASAKGDFILIQYRRVDSLETFNLLNFRLLEDGFELDGKIVDESEMWNIVREARTASRAF
jgi:transcriptional regulator with XRE-family HTH domain